MTVPLFDVKNKLSEYVLIAQNKEPVLISKHGKDAAVLINVSDFESFLHKKSSAFSSSLENWLLENPATEENALPDNFSLESMRNKNFIPRSNPFIEDEKED